MNKYIIIPGGKQIAGTVIFERPIFNDLSDDPYKVSREKLKYDLYVQSLPRYDIPPELQEVWKGRTEVEEGVDFRFEQYFCNCDANPCKNGCRQKYVTPITSQEFTNLPDALKISAEISQAKDRKIEELEAWKESAMKVMRDDQAIGKLLGIKLGQSVPEQIIPKIEELKAELAALNKWVNDLQSGMYVNCVYCGHRYGKTGETPVSMADVLKAHVEQCPKHPMSQLKAENAALKAKLESLPDEVFVDLDAEEDAKVKEQAREHKLPEDYHFLSGIGWLKKINLKQSI